MNKNDAAKAKAKWLAYCLEIGFDKSSLDWLSDMWDSHKDENGNLRPSDQQKARGEQDGIEEQDFKYPTYAQSGGDKSWDEMTELERSNYDLCKALNAIAVLKTALKRAREKYPPPSQDAEYWRTEAARLKELLVGQAYSIWKGCESDLSFDEWNKLFISGNNL